MSKIQFSHSYDDIISLNNLLEAWKEFINGKRYRKDVQEFGRDLMRNIIQLHLDLKNKIYRHSAYEAFKIYDPKRRDIHKATIRDRLLHHALHRRLLPFFDKTFISDSTSSRIDKGTHKAVDRFKAFAYKVSQNNTQTTWVLKCDVRKFFASIDQVILIEILAEYISDKDVLNALSNIIRSFSSTKIGVGLPLGNLTSQLLVNIYMNKFDQFVKHTIKAKYYIRYADDFVVLSHNRLWLTSVLPLVQNFLLKKLKLDLHPDKISIGTVASGADYLGWVNFQDHRIMRTSTKKRMFRRIKFMRGKRETVQSYFGTISHGNTKKIKQQIKNIVKNIDSVTPIS